ncbi:hypothetical protein CROQUDRAFT_669421 [Cronartium quercuum f. sp. fusiforme G11]|uniref:Uncharacterized protein n=1 Tax=Cronartium quercuum f. sp. fusiforme G11 TaxID=708437 RepID=A0A9P6NP75_9BASI|nr:hypothetical protein CROQUDRAFT_669421 [Cronartium quercuum f. sp. fusiforme G11]
MSSLVEDEPFDVFKQRQRHRIAPIELTDQIQEDLPMNQQKLKGVCEQPVVGSLPSHHDQFAEDDRKSPSKRRLSLLNDDGHPPSTISKRRVNVNTIKKHSSDLRGRRAPQPKTGKRRISRFNLLRNAGLAEENRLAHPPEVRGTELGHKRRRFDTERFTLLRRHSANSIPHASTETRTLHRNLIPISKLLLSSNDQAFLRSLAPVAFYRPEKYNWGHVRLTNFHPKPVFPRLEMSSQVGSFPQENAREFNKSHKSISNPSALKTRGDLNRSDRIKPPVKPIGIPRKRQGNVKSKILKSFEMKGTITKRLKRYPVKSTKKEGKQGQEWNEFPHFKSKTTKPGGATPKNGLSPIIACDRVLAPCTPSPIPVQEVSSTGLTEESMNIDLGTIKEPLENDLSDVFDVVSFPLPRPGPPLVNAIDVDAASNRDDQSPQRALIHDTIAQESNHSTPHSPNQSSPASNVQIRETNLTNTSP